MELVDVLFHALGLVYVTFMMALGALTLKAARAMEDRRASIFGAGLLAIGVGDCSHVVGHILADLYGGLSKEPMGPPNWADAYEALSTAISVSLATFFFLTIQLYASLSRREELGKLDKAMMGVTALAFISAFLNWAFLQAYQGLYLKLLKAEGVLPAHPEVLATMAIAVLAMVLVGYVGCFSFLRLARERRVSSDPVMAKRYEYAFWGMLLMVVAVTLVLAHPFLTGFKLAMRVVTALKILMLMTATALTYLGIVGPRWFVERIRA